MMEREFVPAPCRIIMQAGVFTEEAQAHHLSIELVRPMEPEPTKRGMADILSRRERPAVIPREVPEKRKVKPHPKVAIAAIRQLRAQSKTVKQVAAALGCTPNVIYRRIAQVGDKPDREQLNAVPPGTLYGWLEVIGEIRRDTKQGRIFACWCRCGAITEAPYKALNNGARTSCGCKKPAKLAHNPQRVKLACKLYRKHGLSEAARRLECSNTGVYRLLVAGGVDWKARKGTPQ